MPDSGEDAGPAVRAALDKAKSIRGAVTLSFPKGRYDFFKQSADTARYMVSGIHQCWDFTIAIHVKDQDNLTIAGDSALFMMHGEMTPLAIVNSTNILIKELSIDHARPTVSEFRIMKISDTWVDVQIHPDSDYMIDKNGGFWWINADGHTYKAGTAQWYDPRREMTQRTWDPSQEALRSEELARGRVRFYFDRQPQTKTGLVYQTRFPIRKNQGALVYNAENVEWRDVTVIFSPGLGFLGQFSRNLTFNRVRIEPDPKSGRTCASFADGFHLCGCSGTILIENCRLIGLQDDHMNIYGNQLIVTSIVDRRTITAHFESEEQQCGLDMFENGDQITLIHPQTLQPVHSNRVACIEWGENQNFLITMKDEVPEVIKGYILENQAKVPDLVEIRGNYLGRVPTRSILMYCSKKSVIENNIIHRSPMPAVLIKTPDPPYNLQGKVQDLTIRNNVFYECGGLAEKAIIALNLQAKKMDYRQPVYENIKILNNLFIRRDVDVPLVRARGSGEILMEGNRVELKTTEEPLLSFSDCAHVIVKDNFILSKQNSFKIDFLHSARSELVAQPDSCWIIKME
jgi:hypothetical protein